MVVPAQPELRHAPGQAEIEDALAGRPRGRGLVLLACNTVLAAREGLAGRQLPVVADHDQLIGAGNGAKGARRLHPARLVDHEQIEADRARRQMQRDPRAGSS